MARTTNNNRSTKKPGGSRYAALAIFAVLCLIVGAYLFFAPTAKVPPPVAHVVPKTTPSLQLPQKNISPIPVPAPDTHQKTELLAPPVTSPVVETLPQSVQNRGTGQMAIIIDDMGASMTEARSLAGIGVPLTFSIIPGLRNYREVAAFADSSGIEVMIHIPMQSKGWPGRRLEANGLLVSMADADILERTEVFTRNIPNAVGANNHTGSEFTEHEDKMRVVLEVLKGRGLYFVDSVTSPKTVGMRLAKELGMKSGRRQVFLDNEQDSTYILGQLNQAVRLAQKTGSAIAICHPHPATIRTLQSALPGLAKQGITFVPASRLVR